MRIITKYLDILGFSASFLCAIHCVLLPLVLSFGLAGGLPWLESHSLELALIFSTLIMASWSLLGSWPKHHKTQPMLLAALGFLIIFGVHLLDGNVAHYVSALGGTLIAYAHFINWRLLHPHAVFRRTRTMLKLESKAA
jgi:hypothetical protein